MSIVNCVKCSNPIDLDVESPYENHGEFLCEGCAEEETPNINLMVSVEQIELLMNAPLGMMNLLNEGKISNQDKIKVELKKVGDHWEIDQ